MTAPSQPTATSEEAARLIEPHVGTLKDRLLVAYFDHGHMSDDRAQVVTGMNPSTQRPRRVELLKAGLLTGWPEKEKTRSGRWADQYTLTEAGLRAAMRLTRVAS